jgi:alkane 1-monooxygenase
LDGRGWVHLPITFGGKSNRPLLVRGAENIYSGWCLCFPFLNIGFFIVGHLIWGQWIVSAFLVSIFIGPIVRFSISPRAKLTYSEMDAPPIRTNWRLITILWLPTQIGFIFWALCAATSDGGASAFLGLVVAVGLLGASIGAAIAHDLLHSRDPLNRAFAEMLMVLTSYPQFCMIHLRRHHMLFGTTEDRGTARRDENIYVFCARAIVGNFTDGWGAEESETNCGNEQRENRGRILRYASAPALLYLALFIFAGGAGVVFFFCQSLVGIFVVEGLNFVQHYGLGQGTKTDRAGSGNADLAWNVRYNRSNWLMVRLGRHSDHHLEPGSARRHPPGGLLAELPQLPAGYWTMFVIALVPPLWRKIMDPRVAEICSRRGAHRAWHP